MNLYRRIACALLLLCAIPASVIAQPAPVPRNDVGQTGTITYQTGAVTLGLNADSTCSIEVAGTFVGTLQFQGAIAAGSPFAVAVRAIGGGTATVTTTTTTGRWVTGCGGFSQLSVTATAWTSGTATVTLIGSMGSNLSHVVIPVAPSPQASIIANQGTSPWVVTSPVPGPTSSPGNAPLVVPANASATPYSPTNPLPVSVDAPDSSSCGTTACSSPTPIATAAATTTLVVTGVPNQNVYVFYAGFQSTGANSALLLQYIAGTDASCGTGTIAPFGTTANAQAPGAGQYLPLYASASGVGVTVSPAARPFKLPAGFSLCVKSSATTITGFPFALYTIR